MAKETDLVLQIFESVFNHKAFTGRSGTFFAFEGLGSIYWHMVSKLHLAVQEVTLTAIQNQDDSEVVATLIQQYQEIGEGIGIHKSPKVYGAFPTDPYSHTPLHRGAQQPGMTGQVKEDILTRIGELGIKVNHGKLRFEPTLLSQKEFLQEAQQVTFIPLNGVEKSVLLDKGSIAFTVCQVPVIYKIATQNQLELIFNNGTNEVYPTLELNSETSKKIFLRSGEISQITVSLTAANLR